MLNREFGSLIERFGGNDDAEMRIVLNQGVRNRKLGQRGQRHRRIAGNLSTRHAHLAIAHDSMHIAAPEQRTVNGNGEIQRRTCGDGGVVHVAAMLARRSAIDWLAFGGNTDDANHWGKRDAQALVPHNLAVLDLAEMRRPITEAVAANSFVLSGARARLRIELDVVDMDLQRAARNSAFDIDRARGWVDRLPVDFAQLIFGALQLVAEAVLRANAHRLP